MSGGTQEAVGQDLEALVNFPLVIDDGEPLESPWHRACIGLLIESLLFHFRPRTDFYVGGNMFIYFSLEQARNRDYRGPDFFFVDGVNLYPQRECWATWLEGGRFPDLIIELLSPTTEHEDRTTKWSLYEQRFQTRNYYCYDPFSGRLDGWELRDAHYEPLVPNEHGWLWSSVLGLWVGKWQGEYLRDPNTWLRFFDAQGRVVMVQGEAEGQRAAEQARLADAERQRAAEQARLADAERQRAEGERERADEERQRAQAERARAEAAEAELARLRALLAEKDKPGGPTP